MKLIINTEQDLDQLVSAYKALSQDVKLAFLYGDLGAGKTTFVKRLVAALGSEDEASSPTYSLVNEYEITDGKLYHIDLYRLNDTEEALDIGIEEYMYSGHYCLIEWPQVIEGLAEKAVIIKIEEQEDQSRHVEIEIVNL